MDALAILQKVSKKQNVDGRISEAMDAAAHILGAGTEWTDQLFESLVKSAPGDVASVVEHILESGGKRIRPALCLLSFRAVGGLEPLPVELAVSCELLHNASLLHDDVIDEGEVRRGKPSARVVWGNALSVLGGDYLLMRCVEIVAAMGDGFMPNLVETLRSLVEGEVVQLRLRDSLETTAEDYFHIVEGKTASLFRFASMTGAMAAAKDKDSCLLMGEFGRHIGISFQLIDDALDFSADSSLLGKNLLADIGQGKITLPVIYAIEEDQAIYKLLEVLVSGGAQENLSRQIAAKVLATGAIERVKNKAFEQTKRAVKALDSLNNGDQTVIALLKELAPALLERRL